MNKLFSFTVLLCVVAVTLASLHAGNRYAPHQAGNALPHRGYSAGHYGGNARLAAPARPGVPSHPRSPVHPGAPSHPGNPAHPRSPAHPARPAYAAPRHYAPAPAPAHYSAPSTYSGQSSYGAAPSPYGPKRSVYQPQHSTYSQNTQSNSQSHGREMKYTINDPNSRGTTHVTETHIVSNKEMHGAEAEAAMKQLMGSMGSSGRDNGFHDFVKGMGLPAFY